MPELQLHAEGKAVVQLVLPPSMLTRLNEIALRRGVNRSRVIRDALQQVYFEPQEDNVPESPWRKRNSQSTHVSKERRNPSPAGISPHG